MLEKCWQLVSTRGLSIIFCVSSSFIENVSFSATISKIYLVQIENYVKRWLPTDSLCPSKGCHLSKPMCDTNNYHNARTFMYWKWKKHCHSNFLNFKWHLIETIEARTKKQRRTLIYTSLFIWSASSTIETYNFVTADRFILLNWYLLARPLRLLSLKKWTSRLGFQRVSASELVQVIPKSSSIRLDIQLLI